MKRKLLHMGLIVCAISVLLSAHAFAANLGQNVAIGKTKVYAKPGGTVVGTLPKGASRAVQDINGGYYQITFNGKAAWVSRNRMAYADKRVLKTTIDAKKDRKVYAKPSSKSTVIGTLPAFTEKKVLGYSGNYHKINVKGKIGWVRIDNKNVEISMITDSTGLDPTLMFCNFVRSKVGCKYQYGAAGPDRFDASGLLYYFWRRMGDNRIPRTVKGQYGFFSKMPLNKLEDTATCLGSAVFFDSDLNGTPEYVGIYVGKHQVVCAANPRSGVKLIDLNNAYYKKHCLAVGIYLD